MSEVNEGGVGGQDNTNADNTDQNQDKQENNTLLGDGRPKEPETKLDGEKPPEGDKKPEDDKSKEGDKDEGAPEKYEDFVLPEGVEVAPEILDRFGTVAKEFGLSQEKAQKLMDIATDSTVELLNKQYDDYEKLREGWVSDLKSDKDFGGDKYDQTLKQAKRALDRFGSPTFKSFLGESGYGDNHELVKLLARVDAATAEDRTVDGQAGTTGKSLAETMYPEQGKS